MSQVEVNGVIQFGPEIDSFSDATVYVYLEDISRADAAATTVSKQAFHNVSHEGGTEQRMNFQLSGITHTSGANYTIRVHVDCQGDGEIHTGDCITMQNYPVLIEKNRDQVSVVVRQVR